VQQTADSPRAEKPHRSSEILAAVDVTVGLAVRS
jgi:hypothetical protein